MKLKKHERVTLAVAKQRALEGLGENPIPPSFVASFIWPNHRMRGQGAGAAAIPILRKLQNEGKAVYVSREFARGWIRI